MKLKSSAQIAAANSKSSARVHSDHAAELPRLRRIKGQLDGVERMILERRYCPEILQQIKAARSALRALENSVLRTHLEGCVRAALTARDGLDAQKKVDEITDLLSR